MKNFRFEVWVAAFSVIGAGLPAANALADPAVIETKVAGNGSASVAAPAGAPATQPTSPKLESLIKQLGDDSFAKREAASEELKKLGKDALPALQVASTDTDPQIRTGAQALVAEIRGETKAKSPAPQDMASTNGFKIQAGGVIIHNVQAGGAGVGGGMVRMQVNANINGQVVRDTTINENGHKVHIHQDADGIKMEVTDNGETKEYKAKDAADLKKNDPEAFKVFEKYSGQANIIQLVPLAPQP